MESNSQTVNSEAFTNKTGNPKPKVNPYLAVLVGVLAVSFSSLFVKLSGAPALIIAFYRLFFTFVILAPHTLLFSRSDLSVLTRRQALLSALSGLFLALHFVTWFTSLKYTSVASSVVLVTTQPIWVVAGGYVLFREKISLQSFIGGALALGGSIFIGAVDFQLGGTAVYGDLLAVAAAMFVSGYLLIGRRLRSQVNLPAYTFLVYGSASLVLGLSGLTSRQAFYPYPLQDWLLFLGLAVICTVLGHTVFNWALRYVQASVVAVFVLGEPLGAIVWALVFLQETPSLRQLAGGAVILTGLYLFTRGTE